MHKLKAHKNIHFFRCSWIGRPLCQLTIDVPRAICSLAFSFAAQCRLYNAEALLKWLEKGKFATKTVEAMQRCFQRLVARLTAMYL